MGLLDQLIHAIGGAAPETASAGLTHRVVLGALLSLVARADRGVSDAERAAKREALARHGYTDSREQDDILAAADQALEQRLDWEGFTREVNQHCDYQERVRVLHDLFSVAWADHELTHSELETLRKLSDLLWISHKDFIAAKLDTRPEGPSPG